jgi:predicted CXXCH cytochrome family protein
MNDPQTPSVRRGRRGWLLVGAGLTAVLLAVAVAGKAGIWRVTPDPFAVPPLSPSPFLNTRADAQTVGSETCRSCHAERAASFRRTGMGRSMAKADPAEEPPDAAFDHPPSKRRYQVARKDGRLWHRELLLSDGPGEVLLAEYPLEYVVGSGRHSRSYFVEAEGFLVESPVTWYTSRKAWGMSPGYDHPGQDGFGRATGDGCLICHAGMSEPVGGSLHRMHITEPAIGCERCHGPGSLHVARVRGPDPPTPGSRDDTIVNPKRLSRELLEAVCQQCHLRTTATVVGRGRKPGDFRPGLPLQDFRQDYTLETPDATMTVVGHVEQMHLSRCYQASNTLTCLTCHDPHGFPKDEERDTYYKAVCASCHPPERCTVGKGQRERESPDNNCVHCHMPRSPTEIPHLAFTHHRIGVHKLAAETPPASVRPGVLRAFLDLSRFGEVDRKRSLGLGYLEAANREKDEAHLVHYQRQSLALLSGVRKAGRRDPALDAALARLHFDLGRDGVRTHAESALAHADLAGQDRCNVLFMLAEGEQRRGRHAEAAVRLRELTKLRRHPADWLMLADCEKSLGNEAAMIEALTTAVRINPRLWKIHAFLAEDSQRRGDVERAAWHRTRAVP